MITEAKFTLVKGSKQEECPSAGEWMKKMRNIHTVEHDLFRKKNEILQFTEIYMEMESDMVRETARHRNTSPT